MDKASKPEAEREGIQEMRVTENITFSGKVVWSIVVICFLFAGAFYDSKRATASLQRDVLELQKKYDAEIIAIKTEQSEYASNAADSAREFSKALSLLQETMDQWVEVQVIQTELAKLKVYDRWTAGMAEDKNTQMLDFLLKNIPNATLDGFPNTRDIQREHLREAWNQIHD